MNADIDLIRRLAPADKGLAVVATTRPDGSVHASLVNAGVLDDPLAASPCVGLVVRSSARKLVHTAAQSAGHGGVPPRVGVGRRGGIGHDRGTRRRS